MDEKILQKYLNKFHDMSVHLEDELTEKMTPSDSKFQINGTDFENMVHDELINEGIKEKDIEHHPQKFPDFIITDEDTNEKIGLEVKKTDSAKWEVPGGSIYESLKNDLDETYVVMAKLGGVIPEVRLKKYEDCIKDLKVTHSPRFSLIWIWLKDRIS